MFYKLKFTQAWSIGLYLLFTDDLGSSARIQANYSAFHRAVNLGLPFSTLLGWIICPVHLACLFPPLCCMSRASINFPLNNYVSKSIFIILSCFILLPPFSDSLAEYEISSWHLSSSLKLEEFCSWVLRSIGTNEKYDIGFITFFWGWILDNLKVLLLLKWRQTTKKKRHKPAKGWGGASAENSKNFVVC